jgi:hypothetical protein
MSTTPESHTKSPHGEITHHKIRLRPRQRGVDGVLALVRATAQYEDLVRTGGDVAALLDRVGSTWGVDPVLAEQLLKGERRAAFEGDSLLLDACTEDLPRVLGGEAALPESAVSREARVHRFQMLLQLHARSTLGKPTLQVGSGEQIQSLLLDLRFWCADAGLQLNPLLDASFDAYMGAHLAGIDTAGR